MGLWPTSNFRIYVLLAKPVPPMPFIVLGEPEAHE